MKQLTFPYRFTPRRWPAQTITSDLQTSERRTRSPLMRGIAILTLALVMAITFIRIVMTSAYPDGFTSALTPYQLIQPGITVADSRAYGCGVYYFFHETREQRCDLNQVGDKFQRVTLSFEHGKVSKVTFLGSGIQVVDAVQLWGRPDSIASKGGLFTLRWESGILAYARGVNRFSFHLPIHLVVLT